MLVINLLITMWIKTYTTPPMYKGSSKFNSLSEAPDEPRAIVPLSNCRVPSLSSLLARTLCHVPILILSSVL